MTSTAVTPSMTAKLRPYSPPKWATCLKNIPKMIVPLCPNNNNINPWKLPGVPEPFKVFIRREDTDGSTLSGNKLRKLEFLLADALTRNCKHVITCGGLQSNHCRCTALAAKELGLTPHLLLLSDAKSNEDVGSEGNALLNRMCGAHMYILPMSSSFQTDVIDKMQKLAKTIWDEKQEESYVIPLGGSTHVGAFGFISVFSEIEPLLSDITDIVVACASGGTVSGLCIANYLTGSKVKMHAVIVCDDAEYFHGHVNDTLSSVGLNDIKSEEILDIIEGYIGRGYALSTEEELEFIMDVGAETGIILDPVYTGKTARGLVKELKNNPGRFKGNNILFIHTGVNFGLFDGRMKQSLINRKTANSSRIRIWSDKEGGL